MNLETVPPDFKCIGDVMSNFDHRINDGAEEKLKTGDYYGEYPAWNFHSQVWFDGTVFKAMIKQCRIHVETITASTLEDIMEVASGKWGDD